MVHLRADGVQWSPQDDLCLAGEFLIDRGVLTAAWTISVEVFSIAPPKNTARPR
jgi:hypothetical protein